MSPEKTTRAITTISGNRWQMVLSKPSAGSCCPFPANLGEWRELQARWHQFGTFVPVFRAHGQYPRREPWNIAEEDSPAYRSILYYIRLRYRLMPYLYSMAGAVHFEDYTMMRALAMDFPDDVDVRGISDQWMFGPALMPCPVYSYKAREREAYLPECPGWYDFYSGCYLPGGRRIVAEAPYERIPLYVRAGSIIPFGPDIEWSDEKPADPIRLYVYRGADADFTLYEDGNLDYGYEKGAYSTIRFKYDEASGSLQIGERRGSFPGMLKERTFIIVPVGKDAPHGYDPDAEGMVVEYSGGSLHINFEN